MQSYLHGLTGLEFFTQRTQMAAAGLLKLLYSGFQEDRLLPPKGQPQIDNYDKAYLKSGRFTTEWYKVPFDGNPSFGKTVKATIPRRGHLVTRAFLVTVMPDIRTVQASVQEFVNSTNNILASPYFGWTNSIGHALINEAQVTIGATPIDRLDGRLMEVLDEYNTPIEKVTTVNRMIGRHDNGFNYTSNGYNVTNQTVITPLPFWFSKGDPENALPIDAIGLDTVQISINYNQLSKLYVSYKKTITNFKGLFNNNTVYKIGDVIQWTDGNFYRCFQSYTRPNSISVATNPGGATASSLQLDTNLQFPNAYLFGFITQIGVLPSGVRTFLQTSVPLTTVGNVGDLAIVTTNKEVYKKTAGLWVPAIKNLPNSSSLVEGIGAQSIVRDASENIYIADRDNNRVIIYNISTNVQTIIGGTSGTADGIGISAEFAGPDILCIDSTNRFLFVRDRNFKTIRRITIATRAVTTLQYPFSIGNLTSMTLDSDDNLIICDGTQIFLLRLTPGSDSIVSTTLLFVIPTPSVSYSLLGIDSAGINIYAVDDSNVCYKIPVANPSSFSRIARNFLGISDFRIDHDGNLNIVDIGANTIYQINSITFSEQILISSATLPVGITLPLSICVNSDGSFFVGFLNRRAIVKYFIQADWNTSLTITSPVFNTNATELYIALNANILNGFNNLIRLVAPFPTTFIPRVGNAITGPFIPSGSIITGINVSTVNPTTTLPYDGITIQISNNLTIPANIDTSRDSSGNPVTYTYVIFNTPYREIIDTVTLLDCFSIVSNTSLNSSIGLEPNNTQTTLNCPSFSEIESSSFMTLNGIKIDNIRMPDSIDIKSAYILLEYVYLDKPEANRIRLGDLTYRIKQHYALNPYVTNGQTTARIPIRVPNLTSDIYFMANRVDADSVNAPFLASRDLMKGNDIWWPDASGLGKAIFTQLVPAYSNKESEPIKTMGLLYQGKMVRYGTDAPVFFRSILSSFDKRKSPWHNKYYYNIPFGLNNVGHANMDKLQKVELALEFKEMTGTLSVTNIPKYTIYVWAETYGILRVYGGRAGLLFGY